MEHKKSIQKIALYMILMILILLSITIINTNDWLKNNKEVFIVNDFNYVKVIRNDGTVDEYTDSKFDKVYKDEIIIASFNLPEKPVTGNYSIFTNSYNTIVNVKYNNDVLFEYGRDEYEKHHQIGNIIIDADIPESAWGNEINIIYENVDYSVPETLSPIEIRRSNQRYQYILRGSALPYLVSVMFIVFSVLALFPLLLWKRNRRVKTEGLILILMCMSVMAWSMGYQRMLFVTFDNNPFICNMEYIGIYSIPVVFGVFIAEIEQGQIFKKIMYSFSSVFCLYFIAATLLNYLTENFHYCRLLPVVHIFIGLIVVTILIKYIVSRNAVNFKIKCVRMASVIFIIFTIIDAVLYYLNVNGINFKSVSVIPFGLFSFLTILIINYALYFVDFILEFKDKERLQKLAYTDGMTGVYNRRACLDYIQKLNNSKNPYGIVFFDVNNLKLANDKYSHEIGDKLIRFIASAIRETFEGECFCGRYGGDEFIAGIEIKTDIHKNIENRLKQIDKKLEEINKTDEFPFEVTTAYGYAVSTDNPDKSADDILGIADSNMYKCKTEMKKLKNQIR